MSDIIYHYCSVEAFLSIIQNKKIWLSSSLNTNDSSENNWIKKKLWDKLSYENEINEYKYDELFQIFYDDYVRTNIASPFISCFSLNGDLLSQWRGYAEDGYGVSIGFSLDSLPPSNNTVSLHANPTMSISTKRILYDNEKQESIIAKIIEELKKINLNDNKFESKLIELNMHLMQLIYSSKNSAFREEEEVRVIYLPLPTQYKKDKPFNKMVSEIKFRVTNHRISSYFEMDIPYVKDKKSIKEIILGPKNKINDIELRHLLEHNGFRNIDIKRSVAPYV